MLCIRVHFTFSFKRRKTIDVYRKYGLLLCIEMFFIIGVVVNPKTYTSWNQKALST